MRYVWIALLLTACGSPESNPLPPDGGRDMQHMEARMDGAPSSDHTHPKPDLGKHDQQLLDAMPLDSRPDRSKPDLTKPKPDLYKPDAQVQPDSSPPDSTPPADSMAPDTTSSYGIEWVTVPAGTYMMGCAPGQACYSGTCSQVSTYVKKFKIMKYEMTKTQRSSLHGPQPWTSCSPASTCPAAEVMWVHAVMACNALSVKEGLKECYYCYNSTTCTPLYTDLSKCGYRLPSRAEFEYAYRAGTTTEFYNGPASPTKCTGNTMANYIAWYDWNSNGTAHPQGLKQPNAWGIYDMAGNVSEWCQDDCTSGTGTPGKILMGGSYLSSSVGAQAGVTGCNTMFSMGDPSIGFRCARSL